METFNTPPPTPGSQTQASDGNRILAYIIDVLLAGACWVVPFVGGIAGAAYLLTRDGLPFLDGQSIGKKAMGLRAVTEDGQPLTNNWGPAIIRNAVLFIPFFALVELIVMLTNPNRLRLGDQWAKTRVVNVR